MTVEVINKALNDIAIRRAEIIESFISTWLAVNVKPEEMTPEIFNKIALRQEPAPNGNYIFSVVPNTLEDELEGLKRAARDYLWATEACECGHPEDCAPCIKRRELMGRLGV